MSCDLCRDTGWVLEAKNNNGDVTLELIPCLIPDCVASGQYIQLISLDICKFDAVAVHPKDKYVMSLGRKQHGAKSA